MKRRPVQRPPDDLRVARMPAPGGEMVVLSYPLSSNGVAATPLARLTPALQSVAYLALEGLSDSAIAARRGVSPRTVSKQLEQVYRALGVNSRAELAACVSAPARDRPE